MDDEYDLDDLGDSEELDGGSDTFDDELNLSELEELGVMDGQQDAFSGSFYTGYGMSVDDLDDLTDEERDAYEAGYYAGFETGGGRI